MPCEKHSLQRQQSTGNINQFERTSSSLQCPHKVMRKSQSTTYLKKDRSVYKLQYLQELQHQVGELQSIRSKLTHLEWYHSKIKQNCDLVLDEIDQSRCINEEQSKNMQKILSQESHQYAKSIEEVECKFQDLNKMKINNEQLCKIYIGLDQQLNEAKSEQKELISKSEQLIGEEFQDLQFQISQEKQELNRLCQQVLPQIHSKCEVERRKIEAAETCLAKNQEQEKVSIERQTEMLERVLEKSKVLKEKCQLQEQIAEKIRQQESRKTELENQLKQVTGQFFSANERCKSTVSLLEKSQKEQKDLVCQEQSMEEQIKQVKIRLGVKDEENQETEEKNCSLREQLKKGQNFIEYLLTYEKQLKDSSQLMFKELERCCLEDERLILQRNCLEENQIVGKSGKHLNLQSRKPFGNLLNQ